MDVSKALDCISHYLIIAKIAAYEIENERLILLLSSLTNRKQYVKINNTYSTFK